MVGASAALHLSDIPFAGPIAAVRVGRIDGQLRVNPAITELDLCDINIIVAGSKTGVVMVEGGSNVVSEDDMIEAIFFGHRAMQPLIDLQIKLRETHGAPKRAFIPPAADAEFVAKVEALAAGPLREALLIPQKIERYAAARVAKHGVIEALGEEYADRREQVVGIIDDPQAAHPAGPDPDRGPACRRPPIRRSPPDHLRGGGSAPAARQRPVHPGRDPGARRAHPGLGPGRAAGGDAFRRRDPPLHAALQLPALLGGGSQAHLRPQPPRHRPRRPVHPRDREDPAGQGKLRLHHPAGLRGAGVQRLLVDGDRVRLLPRPDGRRGAHQGAGGRDRHGAGQRGRQDRGALGHPRRRGPRRRHGLQGHRHPATGSPPCRWTSRSTSCRARS